MLFFIFFKSSGMYSQLQFMLCCFVLEVLNKAYFICKMLEWPSINQMLQALSFTLCLNYTNSFKFSCTNSLNHPFQWSVSPRAQTHSSSKCRVPGREAPLSYNYPHLYHHIIYKLMPHLFFQNFPSLPEKKCSLRFPTSLSTPYLVLFFGDFFFSLS